MENRAHAIAAITFLIVFSVGAVLIYHWLSSAPQTPRVYRISTQQSVAGLAPQAKVMFKGLQVGHVQSIRFDPQSHARVIIDFEVRRDAYVTHATYAVLAMKGLIGGKVLQLKIGKGSREPLATSAEDPAHIPLRQGMIGQLKHSAADTLQALQTLLTRANALLGQNNRQHISSILAQLDTATAKLITLQQQLLPTLKQVPQLLTALHEALDTTRSLLASTKQLVRQARVPLKRAGELEQALQHLSHTLNQQTLPNIHRLTRSLTRTSRMLRQLARELKARPQSLLLGAPEPRPGPGEPGFNAAE